MYSFKSSLSHQAAGGQVAPGTVQTPGFARGRRRVCSHNGRRGRGHGCARHRGLRHHAGRRPTPAASASVHPPRPSSNTVMFGAFTEELPGNTLQTSVTTRESQLKRKYAVNSHYYDWADPFPGVAEKADAAQGRTPMDTWWGIDPRKIVNGSQDALIRARAKAVAAYGKPMFLRWGAEMNGDWYAWSGTAVGNKPSVFVAAWRHIHDVFASEGVRNVAWVWAPNADSHPGGTSTTSWNSWRSYYPGDAYVDWVGIDGYNWGSTDSWQDLRTDLRPGLRGLRRTKADHDR